MYRIKFILELLKNMGFRYLLFRTWHQLSRKIGLFRLKFPVNPEPIDVITVEEWRRTASPFFFSGKEIKRLQKRKSERLQKIHEEYCSGVFTLFDNLKYNLGSEYDWITNPETKYKYDIDKHWSLIDDMSEVQGDIKLVWEKARFRFICDIIRYDYHYETDCSWQVFSEIESFIDKNPVNRGPNYLCSQEISLRVMNWTLALYYYKDSALLTNDLFRKIINSIYWQIHHVYRNINFSRVAVRNNHALTETLLLFVSGLLFPFLPGTKKWSALGKKWFEQEISYQVYEDGTYLQFSNNYHRVVVQLLTWAIRLSEIQHISLKKDVYDRASKTIDFLYNSMDLSTGLLPNYGSNDGALFFRFNDQDFRDFRPQLQALACSLNKNLDMKGFLSEDLFWLSMSQTCTGENLLNQNDGMYSYPFGGFYLIRDSDSLTYIRCGKHRNRPAHADNLHIDIWYKGKNYLRDNGSYKYNTDRDLLRYFTGTRSHNTVMLDDFDQMMKGPRFTWYNWSQAIWARLTDSAEMIDFEGSISSFTYLNSNIRHRRKVAKLKGRARWIIEDEISGTDKYKMNQIWHINPEFSGEVEANAIDYNGNSQEKLATEGWYSSCYGSKEKTEYYIFSTPGRKIITTIEIKC